MLTSVNPLPAAIVFDGTELAIFGRYGRPWLREHQIGMALGYADQPDAAVRKIYDRHADEFTDDMTAVVDLPTAGGVQKVRIFSPRGCHLLAMFARTPKAKAFRRWVLDVLDRIGPHTFEPVSAQPAPFAIAPASTLADDMLEGADAIAAFMGLSPRQIYHLQDKLPVFQIGAKLFARKSTILKWIAEQELAALSKPSG